MNLNNSKKTTITAYNDLDSEQSDNLWDYYQSRVNMFLYLKNLVNKNTN